MRRRRLSNRNGQALVEFALTVPILLLLVIGIIELGRVMSAYQTITDTAREAARQAVVADAPCDDPDKQEDIAEMIENRLVGAGLDPDALAERDIDCSNDPTTVTLEYAYYMGWLGPLMGWTTGKQTVSLRTETHMRQE